MRIHSLSKEPGREETLEVGPPIVVAGHLSRGEFRQLPERLYVTEAVVTFSQVSQDFDEESRCGNREEDFGEEAQSSLEGRKSSCCRKKLEGTTFKSAKGEKGRERRVFGDVI